MNSIVADGPSRLYFGQRRLAAQGEVKLSASASSKAVAPETSQTLESLAARRRRMLNHRPSAKALW
jgi:hypothetical protein